MILIIIIIYSDVEVEGVTAVLHFPTLLQFDPTKCNPTFVKQKLKF